MTPAGLHFDVEPWWFAGRWCGCIGLWVLGLGPLIFRSGPLCADLGEIVDRARTSRYGEPLAQGVGNLPERPAPLAQLADQLRVGFKLAACRPGIGVGEEISDLVIEVHAPADASTVRLCSGLFGGYSGKFGHVRRLSAARAEWTRIYPNSVRLCSGLFGSCDSSQDILRLFSKKWMHEKSGRKKKSTTLSETGSSVLLTMNLIPREDN